VERHLGVWKKSAGKYVGHLEVLHTVCFLFKKEFILQNTFIDLQYNLHCALSHWPNFEKVLYCCLEAFVFDASDYSGHLIRHLLNASEALRRCLMR
jgi:hypothetical protein